MRTKLNKIRCCIPDMDIEVLNTTATRHQSSREKREREPNWSEVEKQLLAQLVELYQMVLQNKSTDARTIKQKSHAWDMIAAHMKASGYNRSKDRLKQQLGRMRAAASKRAKEATIAGSCPGSPSAVPADSGINSDSSRSDLASALSAMQPTDLSIKIEKAATLCDFNRNLADHHDWRPSLPEVKQQDLPIAERPMLNEACSTTPAAVAATKRMRTTCLRTVRQRQLKQRRLEQLLHYRVTVQRERIKSLRQKQRHDEALHRTELEMQRLKLQMLQKISEAPSYSDPNKAGLFNF